MDPFLRQTARYIHSQFGGSFEDVAIVLPNRRGGVFLRRYLAEFLKGTSWSPAIFSIEEFIAMLSGLKEVEQVHCLIELYRVHREVEKEKAQTFDEFLNWGPQLLSDFSEVDRYLVDPASLFTYLDEVRVLTLWNPGNDKLTEFQQNYLKFYHSLLAYYNGLKERLLSRSEGYQGLIFRHAWEALERGEAEIPWNHVVFTGFNALTTAEEKIIDLLMKNEDARLIWDADAYYAEDPHQEAGEFLRSWYRKWPATKERWVSNEFKSEGKKVDVIGLPDIVGQVKWCGAHLKELAAKGDLDEKTAIVLPDERLLLPLLNSITPEAGDLNITMGIPVSQTPLAGLLELIMQMHIHAFRMNPGMPAKGKYYYRDVVKVLRHPFVNRMADESMGGNNFAWFELVESVRDGSRVFVGKDEIVPQDAGLFTHGTEFLTLLFAPWESIPGAVSGMQSLVEGLVPAMGGKGKEDDPSDTTPVELEYAWTVSRILHQLEAIVKEAADYFTWETLQKFLLQMLATTSLPFSGEPLKGIQVMGMLETRTLDFERVILLSCNEGILPSGRNVQSFIPFDVRRDFNLPLNHHKDAVYAYHFYRLLQRAGEVWLLYNTESDNLGGGEPSRFIQQIRVELEKYNPRIQIKEFFVTTPLQTGEAIPEITVRKEKRVLDLLAKKAQKGFAPTSLNAYRSCPLRFYYSEIAGLKEPKEAEEVIDPKTLGSAVHEVLFKLYEPFKGKVVSSGDLRSMEPLVDQYVLKAIENNFRGGTIRTGRNHLLIRVAGIMIRNFIRREIEEVNVLLKQGKALKIMLLEQPLHCSIWIEVGGQQVEVKLKGFVDRVDRVGPVTRIIDYKTGSVESKDVALKDWDDLVTDPKVEKGFQLLMYAYLMAGGHPDPVYQTGILSLKKLNQWLIAVKVPSEEKKDGDELIDDEVLGRFEKSLKTILSEIFDPGKPFVRTGDTDRCLYCPYVTLCGR